MPSGGEAAKLGDQYEGLWTVRCMLQVLEGAARWIELESWDGLGIEFRIEIISEGLQSHSVKRQNSDGNWTPSRLTQKDRTGRSILGDLRDAQINYPGSKTLFLSGTSAEKLLGMCDVANQAETPEMFDHLLETQSFGWKAEYKTSILKGCCNSDSVASFDFLRRLRIETISHSQLERSVDKEIQFAICNADGTLCNPRIVRLLLADFAIRKLRSRISRTDLLDLLRNHTLDIRTANATLLNKVERVTQTNIDVLNSFRINQTWLPRTEIQDIAAHFGDAEGTRLVLVLAAAGYGKSSILAKLAEDLLRQMPTLLIRLDQSMDGGMTAKRLGEINGLAGSPVEALASLGHEGPTALLIDQVDAASFVGGKGPGLATTITELCVEASKRLRVMVVIACRQFDFDHDNTLRNLSVVLKPFKRVDVGPFDHETLQKVLESAGRAQLELSGLQRDLLRVPLNLRLFLDIPIPEANQFSTSLELFDAFWETKRRNVVALRKGNAKWHAVLKFLITYMSQHETSSVPKNLVDNEGLQEDAESMVSEDVLGQHNNYYRFAHDGLFEYAAAKLTADSDRSLVDLLKEGEFG